MFMPLSIRRWSSCVIRVHQQSLSLSLCPQIKLHAVLSELEAADHSNQPAMQNVCRPFLMLGSCLLNRGALACSHLSSGHMEKVALFLHAYRLIELTASENTSQIVIWQEVHNIFFVCDQIYIYIGSERSEQDTIMG